MIKVTKEEKKDIMVNIYRAFGAFIGTLLAFGWTGVINQIIDYIENVLQLPGFAILIALIYAVSITGFAIVFLIYARKILNYLVSFIVKVEGEDDKKQNIDPDFK